MGYKCYQFVLVFRTNLKTLNVHIINCGMLKLGYSTKPTNKHICNDNDSIKSEQVDEQFRRRRSGPLKTHHLPRKSSHSESGIPPHIYLAKIRKLHEFSSDRFRQFSLQ